MREKERERVEDTKMGGSVKVITSKEEFDALVAGDTPVGYMKSLQTRAHLSWIKALFTLTRMFRE